MSGLFSTFNVARSGLSASQQAINVTSHNISNANTVGYTRQKAVYKTSRPYTSINAGQVGTGVDVTAIERVRNNFLDYQIRNENSEAGKYDIKNSFLYEVESIFNEPSDTGISSMINKFFDSFQELSKQPNSSNARTIVAQQTESLCNVLNSTYTKLEDLKVNAQESIKNNISDVNSLLNQIDALNQEIINVTVAGNTPNDLMDSRDVLLDELSKKMNIKIVKREFNGIDVLPQNSGDMSANVLVSASPNTYGSRFSYVSSINEISSDSTGKTCEITYYLNGDTTSEANKRTVTVRGLTDEKISQLETNRTIWADVNGEIARLDGSSIGNRKEISASDIVVFSPESGELSGVMSISKNIDKYMDSLNKLAKGIAFSVNAVHSGITDPLRGYGEPAMDYVPFFVNSNSASYDAHGNLLNLEVTLGAESEITAKNISINKEILTDVMKIKTKTSDCMFDYTANNNIDGEGDGERALAIANLKNTLISFQCLNETAFDRKDLFDISKTGNLISGDGLSVSSSSDGMTLNSFFTDIINKLGVEAQEADRMVLNQAELLYSLETSRLSISGVSLDEEMVNLMEFQHAYNASAKVISTVDELLDVVINNLKR